MASKIFTSLYQGYWFFCMYIHIKVFGIGAEEHSWVEFNTIKSGKRSAISSDVSEKHSIVYTSAFIESAIIEQYNLDKQLN